MKSTVTMAGDTTDCFPGSAGLGPSSAFWETQAVDSSFQFCFTRLLFRGWSLCLPPLKLMTAWD